MWGKFSGKQLLSFEKLKKEFLIQGTVLERVLEHAIETGFNWRGWQVMQQMLCARKWERFGNNASSAMVPCSRGLNRITLRNLYLKHLYFLCESTWSKLISNLDRFVLYWKKRKGAVQDFWRILIRTFFISTTRDSHYADSTNWLKFKNLYSKVVFFTFRE